MLNWKPKPTRFPVTQHSILPARHYISLSHLKLSPEPQTTKPVTQLLIKGRYSSFSAQWALLRRPCYGYSVILHPESTRNRIHVAGSLRTRSTCKETKIAHELILLQYVCFFWKVMVISHMLEYENSFHRPWDTICAMCIITKHYIISHETEEL